MRNNPRFLFWFIVVLTVVAVFIDLPDRFRISFSTPVLPIIQKKISIDRELSVFRPIQREFAFRKGLDLEGGTSITLKADMTTVSQSQRSSAIESAKTVIERRVNFFGVSEPVVQTAVSQNDYRIIVELPGISNVEDAVRLIGTTAQLSFWEEGATGTAQLATSFALPLGITSILSNPQKTNLGGADLQQTSVTFDQNTGSPQVQLVFTDTGSKKFGEITKRNVNKIVAIVLDDSVVQAPRVNQAILNGNAVITGGFTTDQAKAVSIQLNAGALPVSLSILEQHTIGPTLGETSLRKSMFAGILGFVVIVSFMSVLYGRLGILASVALFLYALFTLAIFKAIPVTLTLAGVAGFILSIGMAVDANILIFERMREEERQKRPKHLAIELGFSRAWTSIRDSNISSLLTCAILYYFGTGIVRGFALTLAIGVLVSMFSAITVTRTFLRIVYK